MTDVEKKLWWRLRNDQLGVSIRRQHPIGPYIVDFLAPSVDLVIEVDGGNMGWMRRSLSMHAGPNFSKLEDCA
jgi:very-short-patch-repair endonuclease